MVHLLRPAIPSFNSVEMNNPIWLIVTEAPPSHLIQFSEIP